MLIHQTDFKYYTSLDLCILDFRNYLVLFWPCISQCIGFNCNTLMLISPNLAFSCEYKGLAPHYLELHAVSVFQYLSGVGDLPGPLSACDVLS